MPNHTWIPIHRETADRLLDFKDRQKELLALLRDMESQGLKVISLNDQKPQGRKIPLTEIDPFTFLATFNRQITQQKRKQNWAYLKDAWQLKAPVPDDFVGIPIAMALKSWWFPYKFIRDPEHVPALWDMVEQAIDKAPKDIDPDLFDRCLSYRGTAIKNLTMGLFWINPQQWLSMDGVNQGYLKQLGIDEKVTNFASYLKLLKSYDKSVNEPYPEFSHKAWMAGADVDDPSPVVSVNEDPVPYGKRHWVIAPGEGGRLWEECLKNGIISVGWDEIGDLTQYASKDEIRDALAEQFGDKGSYMNNSLALWDFANSMNVGDVVYAKQGTARVLGWGVVKSDYEFDMLRNEHQHIRKVQWKDTREATLPEPCRIPLKTLTNVDGHPKFLEFVESFYEEIPIPSYSREQALEDLFMSEKEFDQIMALLKRKKNIVLQGPPGVGKTFVARRLAYALMQQKDQDRAPMVQFHQSYAYEDFIQGYRPDGKGGFFLKNGTFHTLCRQAQRDKDRDYFLVIDEINRGNLSKIFGELMMLMEGDKRGPEHALQLAYAESIDDTFYIPANFHIIGTMNTADRSLAMVDYALRRRFAFITLKPEFSNGRFRQHMLKRGANGGLIDKVIARVEALNQLIRDDSHNLGWGYTIGHSFFCPAEDTVPDEEWLRQVIEFEIAPLLREYWVDDESRAEDELAKLLA